MKSLFFIFIIHLSYSLNGQVVKFEKIYGGNGYDYAYSVAQTYDKGYVVAGATTSYGNGSTDAYILKTDSMGVALWHKTFGGINIDQAYSVKETSDSGFVIAGYSNSFGQGGYDMYVVKTNKYGDALWTKTYGGSDWDFAYSIEQTSDGGYIIAGGTYSYGSGNEDMYLVKTNSIGDTLWTKNFGGANEDEARSVIQTNDGGYILTGTTKSMGDTLGDFYTIKTNALGDTLWTNVYGGIEEDFAYDILESYNGEIIIGGKTKSFGNGNFDGFVIKLSPGGSFLSSEVYGGQEEDAINSVAQLASGRFASVGHTFTYGFGLGTSEFLLYVENPYNGFHSTTFGGNKMEKAYSISNTKDNGYIICGNSSSYSNLDHIYLVKTDSNGVSSASVINVVTDINTITQQKTDLQIFPNPAIDNVYLNFNQKTILQNTHFKVSINDILGQKQYQEAFTSFSEPIKINISQFNSGIYIINLESIGLSINQKFIIQH